MVSGEAGIPVALRDRDDDVDLQPPRFLLQPFVLLLLLEAPGHGYDLIDRLRDLGFVRVERSVYRALERMSDAGLLSSDWQTPDSGPARRVFSVTAVGKEELRRWASRLEDLDGMLQQCLRRFTTASVHDSRRRAGRGRRR